MAREHADFSATEYLTALATECFEEAAALDAAEGKSHTFSTRHCRSLLKPSKSTGARR